MQSVAHAVLLTTELTEIDEKDGLVEMRRSAWRGSVLRCAVFGEGCTCRWICLSGLKVGI